MLSIAALWLPVVLSAIGVFIVSSVIHMMLTYHRTDCKSVPNEQSFRDALRSQDIPPGEYMFPYAGSPKNMGTEDYQQKLKEGPVGLVTLLPHEPWPMGKSLMQWFVYSLLVGVYSAYIAVHTLPGGAESLAVLRIVGATAFAGYGLALIQNSIWKFTAWSTTGKFLFDALVYGLLTGGIFAWLWPAAS